MQECQSSGTSADKKPLPLLGEILEVRVNCGGMLVSRKALSVVNGEADSALGN